MSRLQTEGRHGVGDDIVLGFAARPVLVWEGLRKWGKLGFGTLIFRRVIVWGSSMPWAWGARWAQLIRAPSSTCRSLLSYPKGRLAMYRSCNLFPYWYEGRLYTSRGDDWCSASICVIMVPIGVSSLSISTGLVTWLVTRFLISNRSFLISERSLSVAE